MGLRTSTVSKSVRNPAKARRHWEIKWTQLICERHTAFTRPPDTSVININIKPLLAEGINHLENLRI